MWPMLMSMEQLLCRLKCRIGGNERDRCSSAKLLILYKSSCKIIEPYRYKKTASEIGSSLFFSCDTLLVTYRKSV